MEQNLLCLSSCGEQKGLKMERSAMLNLTFRNGPKLWD